VVGMPPFCYHIMSCGGGRGGEDALFWAWFFLGGSVGFGILDFGDSFVVSALVCH